MATSWRCDIYLGTVPIATFAVTTDSTEPSDIAAAGLNQAILTTPTLTDVDIRQLRCVATDVDDPATSGECWGYTWTDT